MLEGWDLGGIFYRTMEYTVHRGQILIPQFPWVLVESLGELLNLSEPYFFTHKMGENNYGPLQGDEW